MEKYIQYIRHIEGDKYLIAWAERVLPKHLNKPTEEIEHILDYLAQSNKKLSRMSYEQAKKLAYKWTKSLQKKGEHIQESPEDTKVVLDFGDGFKFVRLIGENAYKREGYLMRHCVASYYDKDAEIYSLRDKDNMPHCTIEKDRQIKGKGNGDIHPRYIDYVVRFLEHMGMEVSDDEMKHLGYVNVEELIEKEKGLDFNGNLYRGKYYPKNKVGEITKIGTPYQSPLLLFLFGLIDEDGKFLFQHDSVFDTNEKQDGGIIAVQDRNIIEVQDNNIIASRNYSILTGRDCNILAGQDGGIISGYNINTIAGQDFSTFAGRSHNTIAGQRCNTIVGKKYNAIAAQNDNIISGKEFNELVAKDFNIVTGKESNAVAVRDNNTVVVKKGNIIVMARNNVITMDGEQNVAVGCNNTIMRGKRGNVMVFVHYDDNGDIKTKTVVIDGKNIKEDVFYLFDGEYITEVDVDELSDKQKKKIRKAERIAEGIDKFFIKNKNHGKRKNGNNSMGRY